MFRVDFETDIVASEFFGCGESGARAGERVEHGAADR
jgi:hypothetical protein